MIDPGILLWLISGIFYALCSSYYLFELVPAYLRNRRTYINQEIPTDYEIIEILKRNNIEMPRIKFQITTRGNEVNVIKRGIESIAALAKSSLFAENIELLVVTDELTEIEVFSKYYQKIGISFPAEVICVPKDYETKNSTVLKARSLQYSLEYRMVRKNQVDLSNSSYIFYFDAESTITEADFRRVLNSIITSPKKRIFEGPIIYPHKYFNANLISRQMESTRPFNCYHCVQVMKNPPPLHLHGSNLLVEESLVESIGWDFGRVDGLPLLAEDLMFGLKVYLKYGSEPFGWHGGKICEQPPFSIQESISARIRWITGAWQAISLLKRRPELIGLSWWTRNWIIWRVRGRIMIHSLSFFAAFFVILNIFLFMFPPNFADFSSNPESSSSTFRTIQVMTSLLFFLPGTFLWLFSILNGSHKNIEMLNLSKRQRIFEYIKILVVTPVASVIESASVFYATTRWLIGKPSYSWRVTRK